MRQLILFLFFSANFVFSQNNNYGWKDVSKDYDGLLSGKEIHYNGDTYFVGNLNSTAGTLQNTGSGSSIYKLSYSSSSSQYEKEDIGYPGFFQGPGQVYSAAFSSDGKLYVLYRKGELWFNGSLNLSIYNADKTLNQNIVINPNVGKSSNWSFSQTPNASLLVDSNDNVYVYYKSGSNLVALSGSDLSNSQNISTSLTGSFITKKMTVNGTEKFYFVITNGTDTTLKSLTPGQTSLTDVGTFDTNSLVNLSHMTFHRYNDDLYLVYAKSGRGHASKFNLSDSSSTYLGTPTASSAVHLSSAVDKFGRLWMLGSTGNAKEGIPIYWSGSEWHFSRKQSTNVDFLEKYDWSLSMPFGNNYLDLYNFNLRLLSFNGEVFISTKGTPSRNYSIRKGSQLYKYDYNGIEIYTLYKHPDSSGNWYGPNNVSGLTSNAIYYILTASDPITVPSSFTTTPTLTFTQSSYETVTQTLQFLDPVNNASYYSGLTSNQLVFKGEIGQAKYIDYEIITSSIKPSNNFIDLLRPGGTRYAASYTSRAGDFDQFTSTRSSSVTFASAQNTDYLGKKNGFLIDLDRPRIESISIDLANNFRAWSLRAGDKIKVKVGVDQRVKLTSTATVTLNIGRFSEDGTTHTTSTTLSIDPISDGYALEVEYTLHERDFVIGLGNIAVTNLEINEDELIDYYTEVDSDLSTLSNFTNYTSNYFIRLNSPTITNIDTYKGNIGYTPTEDGTHPTSGAPISLIMDVNYPLQFKLKNGFNGTSAYYELYFDNGYTQKYLWGDRVVGRCQSGVATNYTGGLMKKLDWAVGCYGQKLFKAPGDTPDLTVVAVKFVGFTISDPKRSSDEMVIDANGFADLKSTYKKITDNGDGTYTLTTETPKSLADNRQIIQTGTEPTIRSISGTDGTYVSGTVTLTVNISEGVYLSGSNSPTLVVNVKNESGTTTKSTTYLGFDDLRDYTNSNTTTTTTQLNFSLALANGDYTDGKLNAVELTLPSGFTIQDAASGGNNLDLTLPASQNISDTSSIYIDLAGPSISLIETNSKNTSLTVTFNETIGNSSLQTTDFTLAIESGSVTLASANPTSVSISGNTITLGLPSISGTITGQETISVTPSSNLKDSNNYPYNETSNVVGTLSDQTAPSAPTLDLVITSDTGRQNDDNITLIVSPTFTISGEVSNTGEFYYYTSETSTLTFIASYTLDSLTTTVTLPEFSLDNTYYIQAKQTDLNSNVSSFSSVLSLTIDTTAPTNQDTVLASNYYTKLTTTVSATIISSGDVSNTLWVAPLGTTVFSASNSMTQNPNGTDTEVAVPLDEGEYKLYVIDMAGNTSNPSSASIYRDLTKPEVLSITSSSPDGAYNSTGTIGLSITFTESVTLSGVLSVTLDSGAQIALSSLTTSNTIDFTYAVGASDDSKDLTVSSITLTSGSLKDLSENEVTSTVSITAGGNLADNAALIVDNSAPTIQSVTASPTSGSFKAGESVTLTVGFDDIVTLSGGAVGLTLNSGATVSSTSISSSNTVDITYTIAAGDTTSGNPLNVTGVSITGTLTNPSSQSTTTLALSSITSNISDTTTVYIDTSNPTLSFGAAGPFNNSTTVTFTTSEISGTAYLVLSSVSVSSLSDITALPDRQYNEIPITALSQGVSTTALIEGNYTLYQIDDAGNIGFTSDTIFIDNTPAFIALLEPANSTFGPNQSITVQMGKIGSLFVVSASVSDTVSLNALIADVSESSTNSATWNSAVISSTLVYKTQELDLSSLNVDGKHYLVGVDKAGNISSLKEELSFTLDATAPSYTLNTSGPISKGAGIEVNSSETGTLYLVNSSYSPTNKNEISSFDSNKVMSFNMNDLKSGLYYPEGNVSNIITTSNLIIDGTYNLYASDNYENLSTATSSITIGVSGLKILDAYIEIDGDRYDLGSEIPVHDYSSSSQAKVVYQFSEKFKIVFGDGASRYRKVIIDSKVFTRRYLGADYYNYTWIASVVSNYGHYLPSNSNMNSKLVNPNIGTGSREYDTRNANFNIGDLFTADPYPISENYENDFDDTSQSVRMIAPDTNQSYQFPIEEGLFISTIPGISKNATYKASSNQATLEFSINMSTLKNSESIDASSYFQNAFSIRSTTNAGRTNDSQVYDGQNLTNGTNLKVHRTSLFFDSNYIPFLDGKDIEYKTYDYDEYRAFTSPSEIIKVSNSLFDESEAPDASSTQNYLVATKKSDPFNWSFLNIKSPPTISITSNTPPTFSGNELQNTLSSITTDTTSFDLLVYVYSKEALNLSTSTSSIGFSNLTNTTITDVTTTYSPTFHSDYLSLKVYQITGDLGKTANASIVFKDGFVSYDGIRPNTELELPIEFTGPDTDGPSFTVKFIEPDGTIRNNGEATASASGTIEITWDENINYDLSNSAPSSHNYPTTGTYSDVLDNILGTNSYSFNERGATFHQGGESSRSTMNQEGNNNRYYVFPAGTFSKHTFGSNAASYELEDHWKAQVNKVLDFGGGLKIAEADYPLDPNLKYDFLITGKSYGGSIGDVKIGANFPADLGQWPTSGGQVPEGGQQYGSIRNTSWYMGYYNPQYAEYTRNEVELWNSRSYYFTYDSNNGRNYYINDYNYGTQLKNDRAVAEGGCGPGCTQPYTYVGRDYNKVIFGPVPYQVKKWISDNAQIYFPLINDGSNYLSGATYSRNFIEANYDDDFVSQNINTVSNKVSTTIVIDSGVSEFTYTIRSGDFVDDASNKMAEFNFIIYTDLQAPNVSFTPSNTTFFTNNISGQVSATMNDTGNLYVVNSNIASSTLLTESAVTSLNDNQYNTISVSAAQSNTTVLIPAIGLSEGYYRLYGFDSAGNRSLPSSNEFGIDTGIPSGVLIANPTVKADGDVYVQSSEIGTAYLVNENHPASSVASITGLVTNTLYKSIPITATDSNTLFNVQGLEDGTYVLYVVDRANNISAASFNKVTVDAVAPTASFTIATVNDSASVNVQSTELGKVYWINSTVTVTTVDSIINAEDDQFNAFTLTVSNTNQSINTNGLAEGTYYLYATDLAGNLSAASTSILTIDVTPPSIQTITSSPTSGSFRESKTVDFYVNFDSEVTFTSGTLSITLSNGQVISSYTVSGSTLIVPYTVGSGHDASSLTVSSVYVDPNGTNVVNDLASNTISGTLTLPSPTGLGTLSVDTVAPTFTLTTSGTIAPTASISLTSTESGTVYFTKANTYTTYDQLIVLTDSVTKTITANTDPLVAATELVSNTTYYVYVADAAGNIDGPSTGSIKVDTVIPVASLVSSGTLNDATSVTVQSTEEGTAYLVNNSLSISSLSDITSAADNKVNSVAITAINTDTLLSTTGLSSGTYVVYSADAYTNLSAATASSVIIDTEEPYVTSITSSPTTGTFTESETVELTINFSEPVTLSSGGILMVILNTGYSISITSLVSSTSVTATYTIRSGDKTDDLDNLNTDYLVIGSVQDQGGNDLDVSVGLTTRLYTSSAIVVDATYPISSFISSGTLNTSDQASYTTDKDITTYIVKDEASYTNVSSITSLDDSKYNTDSATANVTSTISLVGLESGDYVLYGVDSNGNFSTKSGNYITIDADVPVLSIVSDSPIQNTKNLEYSVTETGDVYLIASSVSVSLNNIFTSAVTSATYSDITSSSSFTLSGLSDGEYYLYVADAGGNIGQSSTTIAVDSTAGTVTMTVSGYKKNGDDITFTATESGTVYLVNDTITLTSAVNSPTDNSTKSNSSSYPYDNSSTQSLTLTSLIDGTYYMYLVDAAGNYSVASTASITLDSTTPTPTITGTISPSYNNSHSIIVQSSEAGKGYLLSSGIIERTASSLSILATNSPTLIKEVTIGAAVTDTTLSLSGLDSGNYEFIVVDGANNVSAAATATILIDLSGPEIISVTSTNSNGYYNQGDTVAIEIYISEEVTLSGALDITFDTGESIQINTGTNTDVLTGSYTIGAGVDSDDLNTTAIVLASGATLTDAAGNIATATFTLDDAFNLAAAKNLIIDNTSATVTLTSSDGDLLVKGTQTVTLTATFNEAVNIPEITIGAIVTNTSMTASSSTDSKTWVYSWTVPSGSNAVNSVTVSTTDIAGNLYSGTESLTITSDSTSPTITSFAVADSELNASETTTITITLSESTTTFDVTDISLTASGTLSDFTATTSSVYTVIYTPTTTATTTTETFTLAAGVFTDIAGNTNVASSTTISIDTATPTIESFTKVGDTAGYVSPSTVVTLTVDFSEAMLASPTLNIDNGTNTTSATMTVSTTNDIWIYSWTAPNITGLVTFTLSGEDLKGNPYTGTESIEINVDNSNPSLESLTANDNDLIVRGTQTVTLTATFSEPVNTPSLTIGSSVTNASMSVSPSTSSKTWTYTWAAPTGSDGSYTATLTTTDLLGNAYTGTDSITFIVDSVSPTITSFAVADSELNASETTTITITLSESTTTFDVTDISLTASGTLSDFTATTSSVYTVIYTPTTTATTTTETFTLAAGVFTDIAGSTNVASSTTISIDTATPTIESFTKVGDTAGYVSPSTVVTLTVDFSEAMLASPTLNIDNGTNTTSATMTVSTTNDIWIYSWTAPNITGLVTFTLSGEDLKGNPYTGTESIEINVDNSNPSLESLTANDNDLIVRGTQTVTLTATFSEPVNTPSLTIGSSVTNASMSVSPSTSSKTWTYTWAAPTGSDGSYTATLTTTDLLGNAYTGTDSITFTVDSVSPTITLIEVSETELNAQETATLTITLSEASSNFGEEDLTLSSGGTLSNFTSTSSTVYTVLYTPTSTATSTTETVTISAAAFTDVAGNTNTASSTSFLVDTQAPYVELVIAPQDDTYIVGETISLTLSFNEVVNLNSGQPIVSLTLSDTTYNSIVEAGYLSGSGTKSLTFSYEVKEGDADLDGIEIQNILQLANTDITDTFGNTVSSTISNIGDTSNVLVDGILPTIPSIKASWLPMGDKWLGGPEIVQSHTVTFTTVGVEDGNTFNFTIIKRPNNTIAYTVTGTVISNEVSFGVLSNTLRTLSHGSKYGILGTVTNTVGNYSGPYEKQMEVDTSGPFVRAIKVEDGVYQEGEFIDFILEMSDQSTNFAGQPGQLAEIQVKIGSSVASITYDNSISDSRNKVFRYTVQPEDEDLDGVEVISDGIYLPSSFKFLDSAKNSGDPTLRFAGRKTFPDAIIDPNQELEAETINLTVSEGGTVICRL
jgi:hypothetical protein